MRKIQIRVSDAIPEMPHSFEQTVERTLAAVCTEKKTARTEDKPEKRWTPQTSDRVRKTGSRLGKVFAYSAVAVLLVAVFVLGGVVIRHALFGSDDPTPLAKTKTDLSLESNASVPAIRYHGMVYVITDHKTAGEPDESAIRRTTDSPVPLSQWPTEEGQTNFGETSYAMTIDGLVVLYDNEWRMFEPLLPDADRGVFEAAYAQVLTEQYEFDRTYDMRRAKMETMSEEDAQDYDTIMEGEENFLHQRLVRLQRIFPVTVSVEQEVDRMRLSEIAYLDGRMYFAFAATKVWAFDAEPEICINGTRYSVIDDSGFFSLKETETEQYAFYEIEPGTLSGTVLIMVKNSGHTFLFMYNVDEKTAAPAQDDATMQSDVSYYFLVNSVPIYPYEGFVWESKPELEADGVGVQLEDEEVLSQIPVTEYNVGIPFIVLTADGWKLDEIIVFDTAYERIMDVAGSGIPWEEGYGYVATDLLETLSPGTYYVSAIVSYRAENYSKGNEIAICLKVSAAASETPAPKPQYQLIVNGISAPVDSICEESAKGEMMNMIPMTAVFRAIGCETEVKGDTVEIRKGDSLHLVLDLEAHTLFDPEKSWYNVLTLMPGDSADAFKCKRCGNELWVCVKYASSAFQLLGMPTESIKGDAETLTMSIIFKGYGKDTVPGATPMPPQSATPAPKPASTLQTTPPTTLIPTPTPTEEPNPMHIPMICYNGEVYGLHDEIRPDAPDTDAASGTVTSVVSITEIPKTDGQANFDSIGMQFYVTRDGLVVWYNNAWRLFVPEEPGGDPDKVLWNDPNAFPGLFRFWDYDEENGYREAPESGVLFRCDFDGDRTEDEVAYEIHGQYLTISVGKASVEVSFGAGLEQAILLDLDPDSARLNLLVVYNTGSEDYETAELHMENGRFVRGPVIYAYCNFDDGILHGSATQTDILGTKFGARTYHGEDLTQDSEWFDCDVIPDDIPTARDREHLIENGKLLHLVRDLPCTIDGADAVIPAGSYIYMTRWHESGTLAEIRTEDGTTALLTVERADPNDPELNGYLIDGITQDTYFDNIFYAD